MAKAKMSMKLLIETTGTGKRVVLAEAGKECVDFLFHILSLPVATVIGLLRAEEMGGSLPNLYHSLNTLDDEYLQPNKNKHPFLNPASTCSIPLLSRENPSSRIPSYGYSQPRADDDGIVKGVTTYMVTDDLQVKPMSAISTLALLSEFNVKNATALKEKVVKFGTNEALKLLKASLQSETVLSDVFC